MKYIIMCGGNYKDKFATPKQLLKVNGEVLVERTIRLLKENGVNDIAISTNNPVFDYLGVEILKHENNYEHDNKERHSKSKKSWLNAYYPTSKPACYLPGDVYYSENAIKTIIETPVKETMFFCVRDNSDGRPLGINIKGREPLAYKVENQTVFRKAINDLLYEVDKGKFKADPIAWNLYRKINKKPINYEWSGSDIFNSKGDYVAIDDYTTDIDCEYDITRLELMLKGGIKMVKVEAVNNFTLGKFEEIKDTLVRGNEDNNLNGSIYIGDTFECDKELADYLLGGNSYNRAFVKIIEYIPDEVKEEPKEEPKPIKKPTIRRRISKK